MAHFYNTIIMASKSPHIINLRTNPISLLSPFTTLSFPSQFPNSALKSRSSTGVGGAAIRSSPQDAFTTSDLLRKPAISSEKESPDDEERSGEGEEGWVDWEDQILEDTVPLVGFVRMILHSGKYESGDRLSPKHEKTILERLLPHHPQCEKKIGCGVDYITIGYHPDFESSRCLFIVRKDGELVDFSYWKCIKGLIRKNYPLYADSFILRHFRRRRSD